jgi:nucleoside-diphosphate-sugar epimerase
LAAYYSFDQKFSPKYDSITVKGTERLLKQLMGFEVEQFIFSSSMLIHAPCQPGQKINEDWPLQENWGYPASKVKTEKLIHEQHGKMPALTLRIAGVYDDMCHSIPISHQIQRIYEKQLESRLFSGDVTHGASFIHMDDLVDAIEIAVERRKTLPDDLTLLLGEQKTLSYDEMQRMIARILWGKEFKTYQVPKWLAKFGAGVEGVFHNSFIKPWMIDIADDHYELDISRAKQFLSWEPKRSLEETLPKMIQALKADPAKWYRENHLN